MEQQLTTDISNISNSQLYYLLYNSTTTGDLWELYTDLIEYGDMLEKNELYSILMINQKNLFYDYPNITNKAINARLDYIMQDENK